MSSHLVMPVYYSWRLCRNDSPRAVRITTQDPLRSRLSKVSLSNLSQYLCAILDVCLHVTGLLSALPSGWWTTPGSSQSPYVLGTT